MKSEKVYELEDGYVKREEWPSSGTKFVVFMRDGSVNLGTYDLYDSAVQVLKRGVEDRVIPCGGGCGDLVPIDSRKDNSNQRMAGRYCDNCWEDYKEKHSRTCLKCGSPLYNCYC